METAVMVLVIINIAAVAFSYGRLTQKVKDLCSRLNDLSHRLGSLERSVMGKKD